MSGNSPSELRKGEPNSFIKALEKKSSATGSRIILALDPDFRYDTGSLLKEMKGIVEATSDYVCAVKINFHLLLPLSIEEIRELNYFASSRGLASIADIKLNDIGNTNRVATEYLWASGFSAVIVNPFAGYDDGLDAVFTGARKLGKGVVTLAYMSHKGAEEYYGLKLQDGRTMHERFLQKAISWRADAVILGTTRPEVISKSKQILKDGVKIISPGSGIQGGNPVASLLAGADYLIYGRSIVADSDPHSAVKRIYGELLSSSRAS
ncbi:MAG: orotidine 5'-phosphate decarboxylase [Nitrososphaerota archaeon]|nr:orotidine 5'-phosphate decarboxylase [Nitrososphaerota archaeon]